MVISGACSLVQKSQIAPCLLVLMYAIRVSSLLLVSAPLMTNTCASIMLKRRPSLRKAKKLSLQLCCQIISSALSPHTVNSIMERCHNTFSSTEMVSVIPCANKSSILSYNSLIPSSLKSTVCMRMIQIRIRPSVLKSP